MMTSSAAASPADDLLPRRPHERRPPWRQRLVDLERGLTLGLRSSVVYFVHLFVATAGLAAAVVLEASARDWALLVFCFSVTVAAELFHHAVVRLGQSLPAGDPVVLRQAERLSAAATTLVMVGGLATAAIVLLHRVKLMWGE
jgi:hypothetical protein